MKVAIFCDAFLPENKAVAVRMYHLANAFNQGLDRVTVHTSSPRKRSFSFAVRRNIVPAPSNESVLVIRLLNELLLGIEYCVRILLSSYNFILISSPPFFTSLMAVVACRARGIKYVFDVRDEYPEVYFTAGLVKSRSLPGRLLIALEQYAYRRAFMITSVTEGICERIRTKVGHQRVYLLRNGFDKALFHPTRQTPEQFTIVFHGNIGKFQNPDLIVKLAKLALEKQLPIAFKVVGWGNNDAVLKACKLPNLEFLGMIEYSEIPEVISKAHLGISFRSADIISINSFPVKLYEYIGVGLPMIVVPLSEAGDFVEKNKIGFQFSGESPEPILDKIVELVKDRSYLSHLKDNVLSMREHFSRDVISSTFYREVKQRLQESA